MEIMKEQDIDNPLISRTVASLLPEEATFIILYALPNQHATTLTNIHSRDELVEMLIEHTEVIAGHQEITQGTYSTRDH
jgi:hypothetical protein